MSKYRGPIVDVDVHHRWRNAAELVQYIPRRFRGYFTDEAVGTPLPFEPAMQANSALLPAAGRRLDARSPDGDPPGSSYETLREQVLDRYGYHRAILTLDVGMEAGHKNPYLAGALCRAVNDWNIHTWLNRDARLYSVMIVPSADPEAAVAEIRRIGDHPQIVSVMFATNPLGRAFGDPVYHPIYAAAVDAGLSLAFHVSPADAPNVKVVGGTPGGFAEQNVQFPAQAMHYISSFIFHGVFERFPDLKVMLKEFGVAWLPHLVWKLDENRELLQLESPWVRRWPSEYIHDHIRVSTQPIEAFPRSGSEWAQLMGSLDGAEDLLCFSSDYPHYSFDDPFRIAGVLEDHWVTKIMYENACRFYDWELPRTGAEPALARGE